MSLGSLRHDLALARVVADLEVNGLGSRVLTEREIRLLHERDGEQRFWTHVDHRRGPAARHWPDLAVLVGSWWLAVEVELTQKAAQRTRDILVGHRDANHASPPAHIWGALYLAPDQRRAEQLRELGRQVAMDAETLPIFDSQALGGEPLSTTYATMYRAARGAARTRQWEQAAEAGRREEAAQAAHAAQRRDWEEEQRLQAERRRAARVEAAATHRRQRFGGIFKRSDE